MSKLGFYFDMSRCIGCRTCQIACKDRLDLQNAGPRTRRVDTYESGSYPNAKMYHISMACNHCESPACVAACPSGAMFKAEDGTMRYDPALCTEGCTACVEICPYHAPQLMDNGKIARCDSCFTLREKGLNPVCVDACIMRCLDFGDMDALKAKYGDGLVSELPALPEASMTGPNLLIKAATASLEKEYAEIIL